MNVDIWVYGMLEMNYQETIRISHEISALHLFNPCAKEVHFYIYFKKGVFIMEIMYFKKFECNIFGHLIVCYLQLNEGLLTLLCTEVTTVDCYSIF